MYSQSNSSNRFAAAASSSQSGDAVRLAVGEGQWMSMQQAIMVTGLHERTLRRYIKNGGVKSRKTGNRSNSRVELWVTPEITKVSEQEESDNLDLVEVFNASPIDGIEEGFEAEEVDDNAENSPSNGRTSSEIESLVRSITVQFLERLDQSNSVINELKGELQDKDRQLRLLPDLQKEADARQLAELKSVALEKQIEELQKLNENLKLEADEAKQKALLSEEKKKSWWRWLFSSGSENG